MTAKNAAYSGLFLASDMSAGGQGASSADRGGARAARQAGAEAGGQAAGKATRLVSRCALNTSTAEQNGGRGCVT